MHSIEIWKDIPGYEGKYQVSNLARVNSLSRIIESETFSLELSPRKYWTKFRTVDMGPFVFMTIMDLGKLKEYTGLLDYVSFQGISKVPR